MLAVSQAIDFASRIGGPKMAFRVELMRLQRYRNYEREYFLLPHLIDPMRAAVDVGGNHGVYSGRLAQLTNRVYCFEPNPELAAELRDKLPKRVIIKECALSDHAGVAELRIPQHLDSGYATIESANSLNGDQARIVHCKIERLDDLIREPIGFIKIDVEGHELAVLKGAERILSRDRPDLLIESVSRHNPEAPHNVFNFLYGLGYRGVFYVDQKSVSAEKFALNAHQRPEDFGTSRYVGNFVFSPISKRRHDPPEIPAPPNWI